MRALYHKLHILNKVENSFFFTKKKKIATTTTKEKYFYIIYLESRNAGSCR